MAGVDDVDSALGPDKREIPARFRGLADRSKEGSRKAAIRLHCLWCMGWSSPEVRSCTMTRCPLHAFREKG